MRNKELERIMYDDAYIVGYCEHEYHPQAISQGTFEYKGCWTCWNYFQRDEEKWIYIDTNEAAQKYGVSQKTIYRWIRLGKLKARLFVMGRKNTNLPKKFYAILSGQLIQHKNKLKKDKE
jgi:predicted DNA-binding transcriptional regulator AlpA